MSFWPFILCVLIIVVTALVVASLWFATCRWDGLFHCRNYKPLVIVIPITFALAFLIIGFPVTETKTVVPSPPKKMEKPTKSRKKPKKEPVETNSESSEEIRIDDNKENQ